MRKSLFPVIGCLSLVLVLSAVVVHGGDIKLPPRPSGPVADYANVIDNSSKMKINALARTLWYEARFGLIVATVADIGEVPIEEYAVELFEKWGIGTQKESEGVLVLLSMKPRRVRIEVGYGAEGYLNDAKTGRILDMYGVPAFKQGNFAEGLLNVSVAVASVVANEKHIDLQNIRPTRSGAAPPQKMSFVKLIFMVIAAVFLLGTRFGRMLLFMFILTGGRRGGFGGGGFGGGFSSGGFGGGFGGGMSGGGGSSRSF